MPKFGKTSRRRRNECHPDIIIVLDHFILQRDISVLCGKRPRKEQAEAFAAGKSQVKWPDSNHNVDPENPKCAGYPDKSIAVDIAVFHPELEGFIDWKNKDEFWETWQAFDSIAKDLKSQGLISHDFRSGCDWDRDGVRVDNDPDEHFFDGPHIEMIVN